jgi:hypothetical protein
MGAFNIPSKLFNLPSISLRNSKNPLKTLLAKMSEMNEMRNRMREKGVNEHFNLLPNPRLPFPYFISLKKQKTKTLNNLLTRAGPLERFWGVFFSLGANAPWTLPKRSFRRGSALPKNALEEEHSGSVLRERVRRGGGALPHSVALDIHLV